MSISRCALLGLLSWLTTWACSEPDPRFLTPATTFAAYRGALARGDAPAAWDCLAAGYRQLLPAHDAAGFAAYLAGLEGRTLRRRVREAEIVEEVEIDDRVAYLRFDPNTVAAGQAPFGYFLREADGWKITTHMDSLFRAGLEAAIEHGDLRLPAGR